MKKECRPERKNAHCSVNSHDHGLRRAWLRLRAVLLLLRALRPAQLHAVDIGDDVVLAVAVLAHRKRSAVDRPHVARPAWCRPNALQGLSSEESGLNRLTETRRDGLPYNTTIHSAIQKPVAGILAGLAAL